MNAQHKTGFFSNLKHDLPASIVVFLVAVPLCLGIALASGAPLFSGIIAGIVGGIVVSLVSGSPLGVSGPAAGLAVIVLSAIQELGAFEVFLFAVVIAGVMIGEDTVRLYLDTACTELPRFRVITEIPRGLEEQAELLLKAYVADFEGN